jgi:hypothetical protein
MDISVYFDGELQTVIPYHSVVSFRLFCEQHGLNTNYDMTAKRFDLFSYPNQEQIVISTTNNNQLSNDSMHDIKQFLSESGISASLQTGEQSNTSPKLFVQLDVTEGMYEKNPFLVIEHQAAIDEQLRNTLLTELNKAKIPFQFEEIRNLPTSSGNRIQIKCRLPQQTESARLHEQVTMILARAFLLYCHRQQHNMGFTYLPNSMMKNWLKLITSSDAPSVQKPKPLENKKTVEVNEQKKETLKPVPVGSENQISKQEVKKETKAEIFFDYTVLPPQSGAEKEEFLVNGNLYMKNTGNEILQNPFICFKVTPLQGVSLQGQIIPPRMVSGLAMIGSSGEKGWKYVYDDWRERVKTKGEYWITSIHPLQIPPGEMSTFSGLKITIDQAEERTSVLVRAFVYFNEGKHQFSSNNSISFSF